MRMESRVIRELCRNGIWPWPKARYVRADNNPEQEFCQNDPSFLPFSCSPWKGFCVRGMSVEHRLSPPGLAYMPERTHGLPYETVRDMLTEASERIGHMQNTFGYVLSPDGQDLWSDTGTPVGPLLDIGIKAAEKKAARDRRWEVELVRRHIERQQHEVTVEFAREHGPVTITSLSLDGCNDREGDFGEDGMRAVIAALDPQGSQQELVDDQGKLDPTTLLSRCFESQGALWFISLPPSCVRQTGVGIGGGYNPQRLQAMIRVVAPVALSAPELVAQVRHIYDAQLTRQFGGEWHAGQRLGALGTETILDFIMRQPDIIDAHLRRVAQMWQKGTISSTVDMDYRPLHHDFVAAINARLQGNVVTNLEAAGTAAREQGLNFEEGGACPSGRGGENETVEGLTRLGLLRPAQKPRCVCGSHNVRVSNPLDPTCSNKVCGDCGSSVFFGIFTRRFGRTRRPAYA